MPFTPNKKSSFTPDELAPAAPQPADLSAPGNENLLEQARANNRNVHFVQKRMSNALPGPQARENAFNEARRLYSGAYGLGESVLGAFGEGENIIRETIPSWMGAKPLYDASNLFGDESKTFFPTMPQVKDIATNIGIPKPTDATAETVGEFLPAVATIPALVKALSATKSVFKAPAFISNLWEAKRAAPLIKTLRGQMGSEAYETSQRLAAEAEANVAKNRALAAELSKKHAAISGDLETMVADATGVTPAKAAVGVDKTITAGRTKVSPLFEEAFKPTSTAPLKDQYEAASSAAGKAVNDAQQAVNDAENSHTMLLARANDQTSVYGINPGQIRESEKAIEKAREDLQNAVSNKEQVGTDLEMVQADIASGKQGAMYTPQIRRLIQNPKVRQGIARGIAVMRDEADAAGMPLNVRDLGIKLDAAGEPLLDANGGVQVIGVPKARLLHAAKVGLDDIVNSYKVKDTGKIAYDKIGAAKAVENLANSLVTEMRAVNPAYNEAMNTSSKYLGTQSGFGMGAKAVFNNNVTKKQFSAMLLKNTPEATAAMKPGIANLIHNLMVTAPKGVPYKLPGGGLSKLTVDKLSMMVGEKKAAQLAKFLQENAPAKLTKAAEQAGAAVLDSEEVAAAAVKQEINLKARAAKYDTYSPRNVFGNALNDLADDAAAGRISPKEYEERINAVKDIYKKYGATDAARAKIKKIAAWTVGTLAVSSALSGARHGVNMITSE